MAHGVHAAHRNPMEVKSQGRLIWGPECHHSVRLRTPPEASFCRSSSDAPALHRRDATDCPSSSALQSTRRARRQPRLSLAAPKPQRPTFPAYAACQAVESRAVEGSLAEKLSARQCQLSGLRGMESAAALASGIVGSSLLMVHHHDQHTRLHHHHHHHHHSHHHHHHHHHHTVAQQSSASEPSRPSNEASLSQALLRRTATASIGAASQPILRSRTIQGPGGGLAMVAVLTVAGLVTVMRSNAANHLPEEVCGDCEGYGLCKCQLCEGRGEVLWEGKLLRNDPCPACLGDGAQKCSSCGGVRIRKGVPPVIREVQGL